MYSKLFYYIRLIILLGIMPSLIFSSFVRSTEGSYETPEFKLIMQDRMINDFSDGTNNSQYELQFRLEAQDGYALNNQAKLILDDKEYRFVPEETIHSRYFRTSQWMTSDPIEPTSEYSFKIELGVCDDEEMDDCYWACMEFTMYIDFTEDYEAYWHIEPKR